MSMYHHLNELPVSIATPVYLYGRIYPDNPDHIHLMWSTSKMPPGSEFFLVEEKTLAFTPNWPSAIDLTRSQVKALHEKINAIRAQAHVEMQQELDAIGKLEALTWNGESAS